MDPTTVLVRREPPKRHRQLAIVPQSMLDEVRGKTHTQTRVIRTGLISTVASSLAVDRVASAATARPSLAIAMCYRGRCDVIR